jgi:hypothetical protein
VSEGKRGKRDGGSGKGESYQIWDLSKGVQQSQILPQCIKSNKTLIGFNLGKGGGGERGKDIFG